MTKKIITVFGATGAQGGGLARAILADKAGEFAVRAVTRKPDSDAARALAADGAEIVSANMDDPASVQRAMQGSFGAFCVTNFWEHFSPERELAQAKAMADGAAAAGVKHVIWSTLEDTRAFFPADGKRMPVLLGKYNVPHFDAKGEANKLFTGRVPTTLVNTSFYWDNLIHFGMGPKKGPDGVLAITFPMADKRLSGIAVEDIGKCVYGIFKGGVANVGKTFGLAGEHLTGVQMAAALAKALGQPVKYNAVTPEQYRGFGFPGAEDLGNMFQFYAEFEGYFTGARPLDVARRLNPQLQDFATFVARNAGRIQVG
ncbi:MAG TPA: NmrA/HSCARG family protein [Burkholderiaceae bacterium]|nr:NmrA/HSCARG family protein [Burkholderiaceae bacterium]HQR71406.1 NmrA/HSCARG family protein [Burkholderiaceae bacterium]